MLNASCNCQATNKKITQQSKLSSCSPQYKLRILIVKNNDEMIKCIKLMKKTQKIERN